jgi:hypothetical protein
MFPIKQFSFEKWAAQRLLLLKASQGQFRGFSKLFANSKAFCAKQLRIYKLIIKLKGQLKFLNICWTLS